jgi:glutathionylspermidine synthase
VVSPWIHAEPLTTADYAVLRHRAIFECNKWDPKVGDTDAVARAPLVLRAGAWQEVKRLAEALAAETLDAEAELSARPDLHRHLGLSRAVRVALKRSLDAGGPAPAPRLIRFDFHDTADGWRISEANTDVPGGLNEASGFARLMAPHYPWAASTGDPAVAYCDALLTNAGPNPAIALVHATAYSDDQQMMAYLARMLESRGSRVHLASPSHIGWRDRRAWLDAAWWQGPLDLVVRFFPSEWLPMLPRRSGWPLFFGGSITSLTNPGTAVLTQTKRFPLVWDQLRSPLPTWRALLPETRDPRDVAWRRDSDWLLKPAMGRVGEGVGLAGVASASEMKKIRRGASFWPGRWVAQRRFDARPQDDGQSFPCLGVYTVDGTVVGAYGRTASRPLIDSRAADAAVLTQ